MSSPLSFTEVARAHLSEALRGTDESLDGFPVKPLLDHYLMALENDQASADQAATLACGVLSAWVALLGTEIASCPPAAGDVCARLNQRLANTRGALVNLHTRLLKLERLREEEHEPAPAPAPTPWAHWHLRHGRDLKRRGVASRLRRSQ